MMPSRPPLDRVLETNVFVEDVERSLEFHGGVFGFPVLVSLERIAALDVEGQQVLLLSKKGASTQAIETPGGVIPPHDGEGARHTRLLGDVLMRGAPTSLTARSLLAGSLAALCRPTSGE